MTLKEAIFNYIEITQVVTYSMLMSMLEESFPATLEGDRALALSEMIQSNQIKRYEYQRNGYSHRNTFFMSASSKLMF